MRNPSFHPSEPGAARARLAIAAGIALLGIALVALVIATTSAAPALAGSGGLSTTSGGGGGGGGEAKYKRMWDDMSRKNKRWARRTSDCESGGSARIHGGGGSYHGAFQFTKSTWRTSPKSPGGDPHRYLWKTQAVVAIKLKKRDGTGHWPVCG